MKVWKRCIKCGHVRTEADPGPDWSCPNCGVVYAKAKDDAGTESVAPVEQRPNWPRRIKVALILSLIPTWVYVFAVTDRSTDSYSTARPKTDWAKVDACERYAKQHSTHPSTVDFSRLVDLIYRAESDGSALVASTFTAKNGMGLELKFNITCRVSPGGSVEASIYEQGSR